MPKGIKGSGPGAATATTQPTGRSRSIFVGSNWYGLPRKNGDMVYLVEDSDGFAQVKTIDRMTAINTDLGNQRFTKLPVSSVSMNGSSTPRAVQRTTRAGANGTTKRPGRQRGTRATSAQPTLATAAT